jgi:HEPN domain-containing protein
MSSRHKDWLNQAKRDLGHAKHARDDKDYEWACFAAQQAAEKAVKALYQKLGADAWGHSVYALLENLPGKFEPFIEDLKENAKELDKHYIPPRYPNSYPEGAPFEYYTKREAERAIKHAAQIISFCEDKISG